MEPSRVRSIPRPRDRRPARRPRPLAAAPAGRLLPLLAPVLVAAGLVADAPARPAPGAACGTSGYAYAGVARRDAVRGVRATLAALRQPRVASGHVAAWIGVGGGDAGPRGTAQWLQVGLASLPGTPGILYYEVALPGRAPRLVTVLESVRPGERHRVALRAVGGHAGRWRVWVDGRAVSRAILLARTPRAHVPVATAETWDGGRPACHRFSFRFDGVEVTTGAGPGWEPFAPHRRFQDRGYRLHARSASSFRAASSS